MKRTNPEQLFEENKSLAHSVLWKTYPTFAGDEDMHQEALLGLWKACITYDTSKSKFSTYACICILNQLRMCMRKQSRQPDTVSLQAPLSASEGLTLESCFEDPTPSIDDNYIELKEFLKELPPRDQLLIECRLLGLSQKQTAERLGVSQSYCSRLLTSIYTKYLKRRNNDEEE